MNDKRSKTLMGVYSSSMPLSLTAMAIVATLEVFMLVYTLVNPALFADQITKYRMFYIALLTVAVVYILLYLFVRKDLEHRYKVLNIANPLCAAFFFAWSLGITFSDAAAYGMVDTMVFMTFSLTVLISFYLFPAVYVAIVLIADAVLLYGTVVVTGSLASIINLSIFFVFQLVLGISFLRLKMKFAERLVEEEANADIDVLTGFSNRRVYEEDMKKLAEEPAQDDFVYVAIDINGLKEVNDTYGHEAGDRLIIGASKCIEQCFGDMGTLYRIGGDEFVVFLNAERDELDRLLNACEASMKAWSDENSLTLSIAYGYVYRADYPVSAIAELARMADQRMYSAKARYYQVHGKDRRRYSSADSLLASAGFTA